MSKRMFKTVVRAALVATVCFAAAGAYAGPKGPVNPEDLEPPKPLPPQQKNFPLDQTWSLKEINGKPVQPGLDPSLKIDGNLRGSGFTGCNSWSATLYPIENQHLLVGPYALTKKQCAKDVMATEFGFLTGLTAKPTWDLVNGDLVIKGPRGSMRFARSL
jgi:heat shock protein HslJ